MLIYKTSYVKSNKEIITIQNINVKKSLVLVYACFVFNFYVLYFSFNSFEAR